MKNQRDVRYIVIHCTGTKPNETLGSESYNRTKYHYLIPRNGETETLRSEDANCEAMYSIDKECVSIGYIGGLDKLGHPKDTRSRAQENAMFDLIVELTERYPLAVVVGHRDCLAYQNKSCPSFDVKTWLARYKPDLKQWC